jgi:arginase
MNVRLVSVPYDSGHREARMGRGPGHLLRHGLADRLTREGHAVATRAVAAGGSFPTETATAFDLARTIAREVGEARAAGHVPVVLSGNCASSLGTVSGLGAERTGVVWLDAHGDLNTPDTTTSGFFDGTTLATLTGRCWTALAASIPGFRAVPESRVMLVGARDLDPAERALLEHSPISWLRPGAELDTRARTHLERIRAEVSQVYLHIDLDVLDPGVARANGYAAPDGLSAADVVALAREIVRHAPIAAVALTAFDPSYDPGGRMPEVVMEILVEILRAAEGRG